MGYFKMHAIAITGTDIQDLHAEAVGIFGQLVTPLVRSAVNAFDSFFIAPDGSKEGWSVSNDYDAKRDMFIAAIGDRADYCEFWYGEDNGEAAIERHN